MNCVSGLCCKLHRIGCPGPTRRNYANTSAHQCQRFRSPQIERSRNMAKENWSIWQHRRSMRKRFPQPLQSCVPACKCYGACQFRRGLWMDIRAARRACGHQYAYARAKTGHVRLNYTLARTHRNPPCATDAQNRNLSWSDLRPCSSGLRPMVCSDRLTKSSHII